MYVVFLGVLKDVKFQYGSVIKIPVKSLVKPPVHELHIIIGGLKMVHIYAEGGLDQVLYESDREIVHC